jgi:hypothetical protein
MRVAAKDLLAAAASMIPANDTPPEFAKLSAAASKMLKAARAGDAAGQAIDSALDDMKTSASLLNSSIIFAQAGQLEPPADAASLAASILNQKLAAAVAAAQQAVASMPAAAKGGTKTQLGAATGTLANRVKHLTGASISAASKCPDGGAQLSLLTAAKALALATQQLALACSQANRKPSAEAVQALTNAFNSAQSAVLQLKEVSSAGALTAAGRGGSQDTASARAAIAAAMNQAGSVPNCSAHDLVNAIRRVAEATAHFVYAQNDAAASVGLNSLADSFCTLANAARGVLHLTFDPTIKNGMNGAIADLGAAVLALIDAGQKDRQDNTVLAQLEQSAGGVTKKLSDMVALVNKYVPSTSPQTDCNHVRN